MSENTPTKKRELIWLGGDEIMAIAAVAMAIPFIVTRLIALWRERV